MRALAAIALAASAVRPVPLVHGDFAVAAPSATPPLDFPLANDGAHGAPDADVNARGAWAITRGDPSVIVAVIDRGCDVSHPAYASRIWTNPGEIAGNGIDDDGDGLIDDVHGWDFADGDDDVSDALDPHGTLVTGLIVGDTTGLAPDVTVLPVKVFSDSGLDPNFEAVASSAIEFALAKGARVIQISWELPGPPGPQLDSAFADAAAADAIVVVAAGNDGVNLTIDPRYPVALPYSNIVGVSSTDRYDRWFDIPGLFVANYGVTWAEIAAPSYVRTTYPGGGTIIFPGTSASAPLVSAAAALALSANPSLTAAQVRDALVLGADRLPQLEGITLGAGRLDAGNTVRLALDPSVLPPRAVPGEITRADAGASVVLDGSQSFGAVVQSSALDATWSFGDGENARTLVAEHAFETGGAWQPTLRVTDPNGLTHIARDVVEVPFRGVATGTTIESAHPYPAGTQQIVAWSAQPGSQWTRLHLASLDLAAGDTFIVYDGSPTPFFALTGTSGPRDILVKGSSGFVYLRGPAGGANGFVVDEIDGEAAGSNNRAPIARVTSPISIVTGLAATLDASASSDPDGDVLSFSWREVDAPAGSTAIASATTGAKISFTPDRGGAYAFALTVSDGQTTSSTLAWIVTRARDASGLDCDVGGRHGGAAAFLALAAIALAVRKVKK